MLAGVTVAGTALAQSEPAHPSAPSTASMAGPPVPLARKLYGLPPAAKPKPRPKPRPVRRATRAHVRTALTGSPRTIAHALLLRHGWSESQWTCLDALWTRESNWQIYAANSSGAYGIPQSLPGSKMAMMGSDWRTNPITQIRWGLWYIANSYGSPCNALQHSNNYNYY